MIRRLLAVLAVVVLAGCTPAQIDAWLDWHAVDPHAAVAFLDTLPPAPPAPTPGDCDSYVPLFRAHGLPVATFRAIAWRESGCNHRSFVINRTDSGGGLLGINLKGSNARVWNRWCGATLGNITNAEVNVSCAAAAYRQLGLRPWRT